MLENLLLPSAEFSGFESYVPFTNLSAERVGDIFSGSFRRPECDLGGACALFKAPTPR